MVAVWSGSFARKSSLLAACGKSRLPKRRRGRKAKHKKGRRFYAQQQARKRVKGERANWQLAYMQRNDTLRAIGFATYADYLASETWNHIRSKVLARDQYRCHGCQKRAVQVHHKSYCRDVLLGTNLEPLVAICRDCHRRIEVDGRGNKISLEATNARLRAIHDRHAHRASA